MGVKKFKIFTPLYKILIYAPRKRIKGGKRIEGKMDITFYSLVLAHIRNKATFLEKKYDIVSPKGKEKREGKRLIKGEKEK